MKQKVFYAELAYLFGIFFLAFGTALAERANFGMSMVVAPAYLVHLKISETIPWFSFGMAEYCLQAVLLVILSVILRRFKASYLFSFATAVFYGILLDALMWGIGFLPGNGMGFRILLFVLGLLFCSFGVALLFHTYIAPEAYELFVREFSGTFGTDIGKTKMVYDGVSCLIAVIMCFSFYGFGHFVGVHVGTFICAAVNGILIGAISKWFEKHFTVKDALPLRHWFE